MTRGVRDDLGRQVKARTLAAADMAAARTLLFAGFGDSPHHERVLELLQLAGRGTDAECRGLVAEVESRLVGVALYGEIAGTVGGAKIHLLQSERAGAITAEQLSEHLVDEIVERLSAARARYVLAEIPDDPWFLAMRRSLHGTRFGEEARVNDALADGVGVVFLRRELGAPGAGGRP